MVFVKVRETYDLATVQNKMTVISVHTPRPDIVKRNFPGLLMQCKLWRPYSCDVAIACASVLPLDPLGVGTAEGDVAPEDVFNPILYSALSNKGMSQLEARIAHLASVTQDASVDVMGDMANVDVDTVTSYPDEFNIYYGLLSNSHGWKKAMPQSGLEMRGLKPLVYDVLYNIGDSSRQGTAGRPETVYPSGTGVASPLLAGSVLGNAHPMPMIPCTEYSTGWAPPGFPLTEEEGDITLPANHEVTVPNLNVAVAGIIIPPSRRHQLFYRMSIVWTLEFSAIRPIGEVTDWPGLNALGEATHFQNYDYSAMKKVITGDDSSILDSDQAMVSANVDVKKVM